jgi:replicative DNA helicase
MNPRDFAEASVVGCLLVDPQLVESMDWLQPTDFNEPAYAKTYRAIREMVAAGEQVTPARLIERVGVVDRAADTGALLHTWMSITPVSAQPQLYAAMVLEASIRREVEAAGVRMGQAAESPNLLHMLNTVEQAASQVQDAEQRLAGTRSDQPSTTASASDFAPLVDRGLKGVTAPSRTEQDYAEDAVVSHILNQPRDLDWLTTRLRASDFSDEQLRVTYQVATDLHAKGQHVDAVTVAWQQQRYGGGASVDRLLPLVNRVNSGEVGYYAQTILRGSLAQQIQSASEFVRHAAQHPGIQPEQFLSRFRDVYDDVRDTTTRLTGRQALREAAAKGQLAGRRPRGSATNTGSQRPDSRSASRDDDRGR